MFLWCLSCYGIKSPRCQHSGPLGPIQSVEPRASGGAPRTGRRSSVTETSRLVSSTSATGRPAHFVPPSPGPTQARIFPFSLLPGLRSRGSVATREACPDHGDPSRNSKDLPQMTSCMPIWADHSLHMHQTMFMVLSTVGARVRSLARPCGSRHVLQGRDMAYRECP